MFWESFALGGILLYNKMPMERTHDKGGPSPEYERFAGVYDELMQDVDYDAWAGYVVGLLQEYGATGDDAVFDCACGTGALSLRLAKAGYRVTGFDRSAAMLGRAQAKARSAGLSIPFVCLDMRSLAAHRPAKAVTCACDGVNYLLSAADAEAFFRSAHSVLQEDGLLLFDVSSPYKLEHVLGGSTFGEDRTECAYLWRNAFDPQSRLLEMDLTFFLPDGRGTYERYFERHVQRAHTAAELTGAISRAGFEPLAVYEAFTKREPVPESERLQFVARKRAAAKNGGAEA